ncbi:hypothetical protein HA466_0237430 [Hirschfeldia incana]|nr:hypothetical protein HA466_0237430 [Hirschfeldia incana]
MSHPFNCFRVVVSSSSIYLYIRRQNQVFNHQVVIKAIQALNLSIIHFFQKLQLKISIDKKWLMALLRGLLGAKRIIGHSVAAKSKKKVSVPKGLLAVYVGEDQFQKKIYWCANIISKQLSFQARSEEEFGFDHPMGGLTIPCPEDTFTSVTSLFQ